MDEIKTGIFKTKEDNTIYLIGDLHGDYQCMIHCLVDLCETCELTKIFDDKEFKTPNREYLEWKKNNKSIIVFCGDIIHRKRFQDHVLDDECSDVFMLKTVLRLKSEAKKNGGDIILVAGNHEIINILYPNEIAYTSEKNLDSNDKYFKDVKFVNEYIKNSYAWIKLNNILITHGGLCSDYLRYLEDEHILSMKTENKHKYKIKQDGGNINNKGNYIMIGGKEIKLGEDIVQFVNDKYRNFFTNYSKDKIEKDITSYNLFVKVDLTNKKKDNMFWCREWGYSGIDCDKFKEILDRVDCEKMIIAHCPQFISPDFPKMINFECVESTSTNGKESNPDYNIARIDLGMSRCFDYNKKDNFLNYLGKNYNRKISILKIVSKGDKIIFNTDNVVTKKLSCLQYLLMKYGIKQEDWNKINITSDWLGFEFINKVMESTNSTNLKEMIEKTKKCETCRNCGSSEKDSESENSDELSSDEIILCLLSPVINKNLIVPSINQFRSLIKK